MQLNSNGTLKPTAQKAVQQGRYLLDKERIFTALQYENSTSTEIRSRLKLRSTVPGANNRLDIETIFSWDREDGRAMPMAGKFVGGLLGVLLLVCMFVYLWVSIYLFL